MAVVNDWSVREAFVVLGGHVHRRSSRGSDLSPKPSISIYIYVYIHICIYICLYVYVIYIYIFIHIYIFPFKGILKEALRGNPRSTSSTYIW